MRYTFAEGGGRAGMRIIPEDTGLSVAAGCARHRIMVGVLIVRSFQLVTS